jgi:hypothetical protein
MEKPDGRCGTRSQGQFAMGAEEGFLVAETGTVEIWGGAEGMRGGFGFGYK